MGILINLIVIRRESSICFKQYEAVPRSIADEVIAKRIKEGKVRSSAE